MEHTTDYTDSYRDNFPNEPNANVYPGALDMLRKHVSTAEVVVPPKCYFVLGDNRDQSLDSRYWGFVPEDAVVGRIVLVLASVGKNRTFLRVPR